MHHTQQPCPSTGDFDWSCSENCIFELSWRFDCGGVHAATTFLLGRIFLTGHDTEDLSEDLGSWRRCGQRIGQTRLFHYFPFSSQCTIPSSLARPLPQDERFSKMVHTMIIAVCCYWKFVLLKWRDQNPRPKQFQDGSQDDYSCVLLPKVSVAHVTRPGSPQSLSKRVHKMIIAVCCCWKFVLLIWLDQETPLPP